MASDAFFSLSGVTYDFGSSPSYTIGSYDTNFSTALYGYGSRGQQTRVEDPDLQKGTTGTIARTVTDQLGRTRSVWTGSNDTGATDNDPTGGGAGGNDMVETGASLYDNGGAGDGNLTQQISFVVRASRPA